MRRAAIRSPSLGWPVMPSSPNCFCTAVGGSPYSEDGLDVLMTELDGRYYVKGITDKGKELVGKASALTTPPSSGDKREVQGVHAASHEYPQRSIASMSKVAEALKRNFDSPLWDKLAQACIGCGACTYLCPSCHCFDINDEVTGRQPLTGERVRTWDNASSRISPCTRQATIRAPTKEPGSGRGSAINFCISWRIIRCSNAPAAVAASVIARSA